ncbi:MAG TPA: hypothetical protein VF212_17485 [Longimicrobiales bacterium]
MGSTTPYPVARGRAAADAYRTTGPSPTVRPYAAEPVAAPAAGPKPHACPEAAR